MTSKRDECVILMNIVLGYAVPYFWGSADELKVDPEDEASLTEGMPAEVAAAYSKAFRIASSSEWTGHSVFDADLKTLIVEDGPTIHNDRGITLCDAIRALHEAKEARGLERVVGAGFSMPQGEGKELLVQANFVSE